MACRGRIVNEESPRSVDPRVPAYDRSKAAGEAALREVVDDGLAATIINPTGVVGPMDPGPSRMGVVLRATAAGHLPASIQGLRLGRRARCGGGAHRGFAAGEVGENYLIGGRSASVIEIAGLAAGVTGVRRPMVNLPMWFARLATPLGTRWPGGTRTRCYTPRTR